MKKLNIDLKKFDLIWIIVGLYALINLFILLPIDDILCNLGVISNSSYLNYFVEVLIELFIVFICFNIFLISIYNYSIIKKIDRLFIAVAFLLAALSNLAHSILIFNEFLSYGSISEIFAIHNKLIIALVFLLDIIFKKLENKENYYLWAVIVLNFLFFVSISIFANEVKAEFTFATNIISLIIAVVLILDILLYSKKYLSNNDKTTLILLKGFIFLFIAEVLYIIEVDIFSIEYFMAQFIKLVGYIYIFKSNFSKELKAGILAKNQLELKNTKLKLHQDRIKDLRAQRHDFKNELQTIFTMLQLGKYDQAKDYIKKLHLDLKDTNDNIQLDHELAPVLISKKIEAKSEGINLTVDISTDLEKVIIPENKLLKILFNLIDNAIDAMKNLSDNDKFINVKLIDEKDNVKLVVYNSKPIIPDDILNNIFSPGFSTKGDHRGFGLYIVKNLLNDYGGDIKAKSEKGVGTKFICYLPKKG